MSNEIIFDAVTKTYGKKVIFNKDSFSLLDGITFLVGKNGAGKSTMIKIATGIEPVNDGAVRLFGNPASKITIQSKEKVGLQMQNDAFLRGIKVREYIALYSRIYNVRPNAAYSTETVYDLLNIEPLANSYAYALSGGEKKRLSLMLSVIGDKKLIVLDEPTAGIDVEVKEKIMSVIEYLRDSKINLLVSSHDLDEFFPIANNILMVNHSIIFAGTKQSFLNKYDCYYKVTTSKIIDNKAVLRSRISREKTLYSKDKPLLLKYFKEDEIKSATSKDLYQLAQLEGAKE